MYGYEGVPEGNFKVSIFKCYVILKSVEYLFFRIYNVGFFFQNVEYHGRLVEQGRLLYEFVYGSHDEENVSTVMNNYTYDKMVNFTKKILLLIKAM